MTNEPISTFKESWSYTPLGPAIYPRQTLNILLAGCGGTGARVLGPLLKIRSKGSSIVLFDADTVEERNLLRQNFVPEDVGQNKAEVLADRYLGEDDIYAAPRMLNKRELLNYTSNYRESLAIIIGCTDSMDFRKMMGEFIKDEVPRGYNLLWIDAGNERHTGQVALEGVFPGYVLDKMDKTHKPKIAEAAGESGYGVDWDRAFMYLRDLPRPYPANFATNCKLRFSGISQNFPNLLGGVDQSETPNCATRIDLQTVAVNQLAASWIICLLSGLLSGRSSNVVGVQFSTDGSTQPLKMKTPVLNMRDSSTAALMVIDV